MLKLRKRGTGSNLVDMGRGAVHGHPVWVADSVAGLACRWGGHGEGLRRNRGDAAGAKLDAKLIDRVRSEHGNHPASFPLPGIRPGRWDRRVVGRRRGMGRRPRSSPGTREACTWRRGPASRQQTGREDQEAAGEYRRTGAPLGCIQPSAGYWRSRPSCTVGPVMILIAGSMICSISSLIPRSCWLRGIGCGETREHARPVWTARPPATSRPCAGWRGSWRNCGLISGPVPSSPLPVRRRAIPKAGGKVRYLGIATIRDRVAQASLKLVLEPIFEADFLPCSYGFRPNRRAHDAVAEVHHFASRSYEWIVEGDIKACFDEISHPALMDRVRAARRGQTRPCPGEGIP